MITLARRLQHPPILTNTEMSHLAHLQRPARPPSPALTPSRSGLSNAEQPTPLTPSSKPSRPHIGEKVGITKLAEKANEEVNFKRAASQEPENPLPPAQPSKPLLSLNHVLRLSPEKGHLTRLFLAPFRWQSIARRRRET